MIVSLAQQICEMKSSIFDPRKITKADTNCQIGVIQTAMQNDFLQYMRHLYDKTARQMRFQGSIEKFYDWKPKARSKIIELLQISDLPSFTENIFETEFEILSENEHSRQQNRRF